MEVIVMKCKKKVIFIILLFVLLPLILLIDKNTHYDLYFNIDNEVNENIYIVSNEDNISIVDLKYQKDIDKLIFNKKNNKIYTFNDPLLIFNPYGTNITGLYIYFYTFSKYKVEYTISVENSNIPDFTNTLSSGLTRKHEGQIIGLVQGIENIVTLRLIDKDNNIKDECQYKINVWDYDTNSIKKIESDIIDDGQISDGLYMTINVFNESKYLPLSFYDKHGILRAEFTKNSGDNTYRLIIIKDKIFYAIDSNRFVLVNNLGKIEKIYSINLESNHDYIYSEHNNSIIYIAGTSYIKKLDLKSGKDIILLELNKLMKNYYDASLEYYTKLNKDIDIDSFNWAHPNSIEVVNKNDIIISLRETSSIIYIANIYTNPYIKYIIAPKGIYDGTEYTKYLLKQDGNFNIHAGQHTVILENDNKLKSGQYYLYMFNNNYAKSDTVFNDDWVKTIKDVGNKNKSAKNSMFYKYLIDENLGTFSLVDSFLLDYSNTKSNIQMYNDNHYVVTVSSKNTIYEYDGNKKIVLRLKLDDYYDIYRVYKLDMKDFWFDSSYQYTDINNILNNTIKDDKENNSSDFYYSKKTNTILGVNSSSGNSRESDIVYYDNIYFTMYDYHLDTLIIPSNINGVEIKKITGINYLNVKKIIISEGIEVIGDYAFLGCKNLEEIVLPDTLKKIGKYSFVLSNKIKVINIPDSVEYIGREAFKGWNKNQIINISKNIDYYSNNWNNNSNAKINVRLK